MWICVFVSLMTLAEVICRVQFSVVMPEVVSAALGSDAEIPCTFNNIDYITNLHGRWLKKGPGPDNPRGITIYDSKNSSRQHSNYRGRAELKGNLAKGQCSLQIKDIRKSDVGTYQFIVEIFSSWIYSTYRTHCYEVRLSVLSGLEKPSVNSSIVVVEGSSSLLYCTARAKPPLSLRWVKNGEELSRSSTGELKQFIHNISSEDDGEYWCVAKNNQGTVNSSTQISVQYKPIIIAGPNCTSSAYWTNCTCRIRANPPANITWGLNGRIITKMRSDVEISSWVMNRYLLQSSLRLDQPTETGNLISCVATNKHGDCVSKYQLHSEGKKSWTPVFVTGGAAAGLIVLIAVVVKVMRQRKKVREATSVMDWSGDAVIYSTVLNALNTESDEQYTDARLVTPQSVKPAQSEEIVYTTVTISNLRKHK
ncbi:myelin-associated glycoprotein-like [Heterodontus francisci]|uniref:myelin-associated glycoprotein-like n=1 Tax=Heterodontus francisci TaxID=7792 RepID=UPI00355B79FD